MNNKFIQNKIFLHLYGFTELSAEMIVKYIVKDKTIQFSSSKNMECKYDYVKNMIVSDTKTSIMYELENDDFILVKYPSSEECYSLAKKAITLSIYNKNMKLLQHNFTKQKIDRILEKVNNRKIIFGYKDISNICICNISWIFISDKNDNVLLGLKDNNVILLSKNSTVQLNDIIKNMLKELKTYGKNDYYEIKNSMSNSLFRICAYHMNNKFHYSLVYYKNNIVKYYNVNGKEWYKDYDENGNIIHYKDANNDIEWWKEYDENNNEIYYKNINENKECWREYDKDSKLILFKTKAEKYYYNENGNVIHYKNNKDEERWYEYDENDNIIYYKNNNGYEYWKEYDKNDNEIYYKNANNDIEWWKEYDENNNEIHYKDSNGCEWYKEYDKNGNVIYYKDTEGKECWKEYDENNNEIYYKDNNEYEYYKEYDENGNIIHYKDTNNDIEYWSKFNNNRNVIYHKNNKGEEYWYNDMGKLIHYKNINNIEWLKEYDTNGKLILFKNNNEYIINKCTKGKLIVFEGLDYSFKETNTKELLKYIQDNITEKVILLSFPNYKDEGSVFVKKYLAGEYGQASNVDPYEASLFYTLDRYNTIKKEKIQQKLDEGYYIICDRYIGSNLSFQSTKLQESEKQAYLDWAMDLEFNKLHLPKPDITIYMDMPIDISFNKMQERSLKNKLNKDQHESDYEFMKQVESNARTIAQKLDWKIINLGWIRNQRMYIKNKFVIKDEILKILGKNNIIEYKENSKKKINNKIDTMKLNNYSTGESDHPSIGYYTCDFANIIREDKIDKIYMEILKETIRKFKDKEMEKKLTDDI